MSATAGDEAAVAERLEALRRKLGKKQYFEEAVADLASTLRDRYAGASPALRESVRPTSPRLTFTIPTGRPVMGRGNMCERLLDWSYLVWIWEERIWDGKFDWCGTGSCVVSKLHLFRDNCPN